MPNLSATMDFDTATAIANGRRFIDTVRNIQRELIAVGNVSAAVAGSLNQIGAAATRAGQGLGGISAVTNNVTNNFHQIDNSVTNTATSIERADRTFDSFIRRLAAPAMGLVGLQSVAQMAREVADSLRQALEAQEKLVQQKWDQDTIVRSLMEPLGLRGEAGVQQARQVLNQFVAGTPLTYERAGAALASAQSIGFDLKSQTNRDITRSTALLAERVNLPSNAMDDLFKIVQQTMAQRGVTDAAGGQKILSQIEETAKVTGLSRNQETITNLLRAVQPAIAQGVPVEDAFATAATAMTLYPGGMRGAQVTRSMYQAAELANPLTRARVARRAAEAGLIQAAPVTDEMVDRELAGDSEAAQAVRRAEDSERIASEQIAAEETAFNLSLEQRKRSKGGLGAAEESSLRERHRIAQDRRAATRDNAALDARQRRAKLREGMEGKAAELSIMQQPLQRRMEIIYDLTQRAGTPQDAEDLDVLLGGATSRQQFAAVMSGPAAQKIRARVRAGFGSATVERLAEQEAQYAQEPWAVNAAQETAQQVEGAAAVSGADEDVQRLFERAESVQTRRSAMGEYLPKGAGEQAVRMARGAMSVVGVDLRLGTKDMQQAQESERLLYVEMQQYISTLTPAMRQHQIGRNLIALFGQYHRHVVGRFAQTPDAVKGSVQEFAKAFYRIREQIRDVQGRAKPGAGLGTANAARDARMAVDAARTMPAMPNPESTDWFTGGLRGGPTTDADADAAAPGADNWAPVIPAAPATDGAAGPQSNNVSIQNYFALPGRDFDTPGRLS